MKYFLLIPLFGFYLIRDAAVLLAHHDLVRGLSIFLLLFLFLLFFSAWLNVVRELSHVRKRLGSKTYEWMIG